jgi:membrane-bound lytic murein transglycosylase D
VRRGDTVVTVADRFGISVEELRRWNHLSSNGLRVRSSLAVAEPVKLAPGMHTRGAARSKARSHSPTRSAHTHATSKTVTSERMKHTSSNVKSTNKGSKKKRTATR